MTFASNIQPIYHLAVAMAIGLLIGLQREHAYGLHKEAPKGLFAGVRTFTLMAMVGWLGAASADYLSSAIGFATIVVPVLALIAMSYVVSAQQADIGMTTEVAAVITVGTGALCYWSQLPIALTIGIATMGLLSLKPQLHRFAKRLTNADLIATLKFAVIAVVVLPILPNIPLGEFPFDVLNPRKIWLMVVFISGISYLGYILMQLMDTRQGVGLSGFLGGLVSSTAVTLTYSQRSRSQPELSRVYALGILIAWTVMLMRLLIEVAVINRALLGKVWLPFVVAIVFALAYAAILYRLSVQRNVENVEVSNPFELWPAIQFGLLYGVILFVANIARYYFGDAGVLLSSAVAGLADTDAITLSMANLSLPGGGLDLTTASRAIIIATISNTLVKGGIVLGMSSPILRKTFAPSLTLVFILAIFGFLI